LILSSGSSASGKAFQRGPLSFSLVLAEEPLLLHEAFEETRDTFSPGAMSVVLRAEAGTGTSVSARRPGEEGEGRSSPFPFLRFDGRLAGGGGPAAQANTGRDQRENRIDPPG